MPEHLSPEYGLINHAKVGFLLQAVKANPFGSDFFFWVDVGAGHGVRSFRSPWCPCSAMGTREAITLAAPDAERVAQQTEARYFSGARACRQAHERWALHVRTCARAHVLL